MNIGFKDNETRLEFPHIKKELQVILLACGEYCREWGYDCVVTDLLSDAFSDAKLGRVSTSHIEGRAADLRNKNWSEDFNTQFIKWLESQYGKMGAISKTDGKRRIVVDHEGTARHLHIQIARS